MPIAPRSAALVPEVYQLLVDTVDEYAIVMLDPDGRVSSWSRGAEMIEGYGADEIVGRHVSTFYPPEDVAAGKPEADLSDARERGRVEREGWRVRKDGTKFWASVVTTALRDADGAFLGYGELTRDLSDRQRVEQELRISEERFRLLVESVRDYAIFLLDPEGNVTTWNRGAESIKGYRYDEIVGKNFCAFFTPEEIAAGRPARELATAASEGRFEEEGWRVRKDGSRFWANVVVTPMRAHGGDLIGFAKVTRDLTARRAAEETARALLREQTARAVAQEGELRLREERERYRALSHRLEAIMDGVPDSIIVEDPSGKLLFANTAAARVCGVDTVADLLAGGPSASFQERFEVLDETGKPFPADELPGSQVLRGAASTASAVVRVREREGGREWWSSLRANAIRKPDGTLDLAVNIWHDVSAERRREEHEKCLARASSALASSLDVDVLLGNFAQVLVPATACWCAIHLLEGRELRTAAVAHGDAKKLAFAREFQRRHPPDRRARRGPSSVVRTGEPELYPVITDELLSELALDPEGRWAFETLGAKSMVVAPIWVRGEVTGTLSLVSAVPGRRYDGDVIALVEELGRRAGTAIETATLYASAQAAAKRAEEASRIKDEFLATVSHELRTPLNAILGWASLLRDKSIDKVDPAVAKGIDVIYRNAQSQGKIIEDILDVSRIITGKLRLDLKVADLSAIVRDAIEVITASAKAKNISVRFDAPASPAIVAVDPERVQQVIWNLLSNAVKFTDPNGTITIEVRQDGSRLVASVTDTGKGIDPDFLPYVFDRFKQADSSTTRRFGGLGLGLAIVRHIVELHGGQVSAASEGPGKGATFTIALPVRAVMPVPDGRDAATSHAQRPPSGRPPLSIRGLRVLVVDDEPDARDLVATVLDEAGGVVETAVSASEGFELLQRFRPHVLVSDIGMPDEDGYTLMRRVRALDHDRGGDVPAIALTAYARAEDRTKAMSVGFTAHIGKPVNPDDLVAAVANLGATVSPSSTRKSS